jgi:hypothetical protein
MLKVLHKQHQLRFIEALKCFKKQTNDPIRLSAMKDVLYLLGDTFGKTDKYKFANGYQQFIKDFGLSEEFY